MNGQHPSSKGYAGRELLHRVKSSFRMLDIRAVRVREGRCPLCGPTVIVKLADSDISVRCVRCGASAITMSLARLITSEVPDLKSKTVYELSARGPLFEFLREHAGTLTYSEYIDDVRPGEYVAGVQCQDVQQLTYADASFDVCTSTEVFEHVPDDRLGFREVRRVLKRGGLFAFTVPLAESGPTVERARLVQGEVEHLLPPQYHSDRIRGHSRVLVFRDYGRDISDRLSDAGFSQVTIDESARRDFWGFGRSVVLARTE